jgi:uncharacterized iron-regulated protein
MKNRFFLSVFFLSSLSFSAQSQDSLSEKNYRIYSVQQQKEVSLDDIVTAMAAYDVLFVGEEHNDSVTHYIEKTLLRRMHNQYGQDLALSMEMFDRDVQPIMDEYLDGFIREKNFTKDARVWNNYRDYKPMVEYAKENKLEVICANAPSRYTNMAGRLGQESLFALPREHKQWIAPLPYDTASGDYYEKLTGMMGGHAPTTDTSKTKMPAMSMGNFNLVVAQSLWDATMAWSIASYLKHHRHHKVMQVNGKFHSDEGFAVATQLENYRPGTTRLIISTSSDEDFPNIHWDDYKNQGDYIIITDPKVPRTYND